MLIHTICPAMHRLFIVPEINTIKTAIVRTNIHLTTLRNQQLQSMPHNGAPSLLLQIILKCTTTQSSSEPLNRQVLFSLHTAIDMNKDSYIRSRLLSQSPPRWGLGQTLHDSARTLLPLFTLGQCLPGNQWLTLHDLPAPAAPGARKTPGLNEPTSAWARATVGKAFLFMDHFNLRTPSLDLNKHYLYRYRSNKSLTLDRYLVLQCHFKTELCFCVIKHSHFLL